MAKLDNDDAKDVMSQLDHPCWQCGGRGTVEPSAALGSECDVCYGTGYQPTRAGIELLNFLRRQRKRIERERL